MVFQVIPLLIKLAAVVAIQAIGYMLTGKPRPPKPAEVEEIEGPTSEEGQPIPVIFGEVWIEAPNCIWSGDIDTDGRKITP